MGMNDGGEGLKPLVCTYCKMWSSHYW